MIKKRYAPTGTGNLQGSRDFACQGKKVGEIIGNIKPNEKKEKCSNRDLNPG